MYRTPRQCSLLPILLAAVLCPGIALAVPTYGGLYVFGDSTSDNGNAANALGGTTTSIPVPSPPGNSFVPAAPYDRGAPRDPAFTDARVWAELLADALGLPTLTPSWRGGTDVAIGGARMRITGAPGAPPAVPQQVDAFIAGLDAASANPSLPDAPADALYVIFAGGNDLRDAATLALAGGAATDIEAIGTAYGLALAGAVGDLVLEGARNFIIVNLPDIGLTPAVRSAGPAVAAQASVLSSQFNGIYGQVMDFLDAQFATTLFSDVDLLRVDLASLLADVENDPAAYGLSNVVDACVADPACIADPSTHLYWDGIHVTGTGHAIIANAMLSALEAASVPAPVTLVLVIAAAGLTTLLGRRRSPPVPDGTRPPSSADPRRWPC